MEQNNCIMLIEDDHDLNEIMAAIIKMAGNYHVIQCYSGQSALDMLLEQNIRPELVLCDVNMPELSGLNFAQQQMAKNINLNICFMSGDFSRENILQALKLGAVDFISKPFDYEEILEKIPRLVKIGQDKSQMDIRIDQDPNSNRMHKEMNLLRAINSIPKAK